MVYIRMVETNKCQEKYITVGNLAKETPQFAYIKGIPLPKTKSGESIYTRIVERTCQKTVSHFRLNQYIWVISKMTYIDPCSTQECLYYQNFRMQPIHLRYWFPFTSPKWPNTLCKEEIKGKVETINTSVPVDTIFSGLVQLYIRKKSINSQNSIKIMARTENFQDNTIQLGNVTKKKLCQEWVEPDNQWYELSLWLCIVSGSVLFGLMIGPYIYLFCIVYLCSN